MGRFDWDRSAEDRPGAKPVRLSPSPGQILRLPVERTHPAVPGREPSRNLGRGAERGLDATGARVLADVGTFRALALEDIARYHYQGNIAQALNVMNRFARMGSDERFLTGAG